MARTKSFSCLFLLPLIVGSFLTSSKAEEHPRKENRISFESDEIVNKVPQIPSGFRNAQEGASFVSTQIPVAQAKYRSVHEKVPYPTYIPRAKNSYRKLEERGQEEEGQDRYGYREAGTKLGFRKSLVNEIRDVLDAFDKTYLENGKCEKLREKISKLLGFARMALDFVN